MAFAASISLESLMSNLSPSRFKAAFVLGEIRAVLSFDFTHPENNHTAVNKPMPAQRFFIVAALAI
jgi:hypothetical protein